MRTLWGWAALALVPAGLAGCGGSWAAPYLDAVREKLRAEAELTDTLARVTDRESFRAARERMRQDYEKCEQIRRKFMALPPPSDAVKDRVEQELGNEVAASVARLARESKRVQDLVGEAEFMELQSLK